MKQYSPIKICLFDFDGTLVDTMSHFADLAGSIIEKEYQIPYEKAKSLYYESSGIPFFQQLKVLFPSRPANSQMAEEFEERKKELFFSESFSNDTVLALEQLKSKNYKIAISSGNFKHLVDKFLEKESIHFDYVLGFEENFAKGKDHFTYIKEQENCASNEILFIGDSLKDAEKAIECHIPFIGKLGTFHKEDFEKHFPNITTINNLTELPEILTQ